MACKFVLVNGSLRFSASVEFHQELVKDNRECNGGGYWYWDKEKKTILLYSSSDQFGKCSLEQIEAAVEETYFSHVWNEHTVLFSDYESLAEALIKNKEIHKINR